jgi:hypothetical protein
MSGTAAGRITPIKVNSVHQRSLSRSSNSTGSVPNSPKTHEIFHFDQSSPVSKHADAEPAQDGTLETAIHINAEHVGPAEKAADERVVRVLTSIR